ncbi:PF11827 family protein [Leptospira fainei serovar Hurstbridge str. BUT 6]|uniref:PF11827 family protein n=1 Tax=Leptospira fainei serovar Hurstbridge str. BUT 6 TaxID=1193011 RepID=S3V0I2_9LEPT|nr:DUF3347 domain-containing protein [Leptospira fainei]EPG74099.1 PF11827 family protein [Leptospira fainei serovar Hurstbridge str. BUT 6]
MKFSFVPVFCLIVLTATCGKKEVKPILESEKPLFEALIEQNETIVEGLLKSENQAPDIKELEKALDILIKANGGLAESAIEMKKALTDHKTSDVEGAFLAYSAFSEILATTMKARGLDYGRNRFYCPMVKKTWVASGKKIRNPYAPEMRDCGDLIP